MRIQFEEYFILECDEAPFGSGYSLTQCGILEGRSPNEHRSEKLQTPPHTYIFFFY